MSVKTDKINVNIDNKPYRVNKGLTILQATEQHNIYIPRLCAHKDLSPYGGCRICIVEVEGMRTFPTACTTPVEDGMVIRTHTTQIQSARREILQLFMSEHPSSCLICDEKEECKLYSETIHKAGVTTGCRYCPKDSQCELQDVVEYMGINEIDYPIHYRNLRVEKEDPFYDRDYNLCILCGRCIRMCQEVRLANILAFKHRGRQTVIGPAYSRSHFEAGCEFCGACVSVCPTGTLAEKSRKWDGKPDREQVTTCSYCGVGCQMKLLIKNDRIIGSLPVDDPVVNNGQLCVKGRFCITEMVNGYKRLTMPSKAYVNTAVEIGWEEAIGIAAEKLSGCAPDEFGMLISPNCTNEDLYVAQKFTRVVMKSHNIGTSARVFYGTGFNAYLNLLKKSIPLSEVCQASVILCLGLDTRFGRSVVGVELRRALKTGAKIITINPHLHNLTLIAEKWIRPTPGSESDVFDILIQLTSGEASSVKSGLADQKLMQVSNMLKKASSSAILVGSEFLHHNTSAKILNAIALLAKNIGAGILALPAQNNLYGSVLMGAYPEFLPGGLSSAKIENIMDVQKNWGLDIQPYSTVSHSWLFASQNKLKVLYLIGETPIAGNREQADFLIWQNIYPPEDDLKPDLLLPAAAFTETEGTYFNGEGRIQKLNKAVNPPGQAMPDWKILSHLAQKMGVKGFEYQHTGKIHNEISSSVKRFGNFKRPDRKPKSLKCDGFFTPLENAFDGKKEADNNYPFLLTTSGIEHSYRGIALSNYVEGAKKIFAERTLRINPKDAKKARIENGDEVIVISPEFKKVWPARISPELMPGILHIALPQSETIGPNPHHVKIRKNHV